MKLYLVRHGQTDWNIKKQLQGITDIELNATGIQQAENLAQQIQSQGIKFDACYVSPLKRAQKTAKIITNNNIELITEPLIIERYFGELEEKAVEPHKLGLDLYDVKLNTGDYGIEPIRTLLERTQQFVDKLKTQQQPTDTVLIVAHGALLRALCASIVGRYQPEDFADFRFANCEMREYDIES